MVLVQATLAPFINQEFVVTGAWGEPRSGHIHAGIDLASLGSGGVAKPVYSMSEGIVTRVDQTDQGTGYGAMCIIWNQSNNDLWLYGDLGDNSIPLTVGQNVVQGTQVGVEGNPTGTASTGLHVHLEKENQSDGIFKFGYNNSIDPTTGTGILNEVYTTSDEYYIFDGTPVPPTRAEKKRFPWVIYANKLRNNIGGII
jgi:murein DD-endopeptidase MepM/ murein hydrolase activator NlpD